MWVTLIILGTFFRGPNWNFFGPFESWDAHKVLAQNNIDLSQYFWIMGLHRSSAQGAAGQFHSRSELGGFVWRELPGIFCWFCTSLPCRR